jgi:hypothetical protein
MDKRELFIAKYVPALALWAATKVLEQPRVDQATARLQRRVGRGGRRTAEAIRTAARNARRNRIWLAAGSMAVLVGIGLLTRAARR